MTKDLTAYYVQLACFPNYRCLRLLKMTGQVSPSSTSSSTQITGKENLKIRKRTRVCNKGTKEVRQKKTKNLESKKQDLNELHAYQKLTSGSLAATWLI